MNCLLDTNVVSELRKRQQGHAPLHDWAKSSSREQHFVSVITLGEIRFGIERLRSRRQAETGHLDSWLEQLQADYSERIIPVNADVADRFGRLQAIRTFPVADALLAATALVYGLVLVTRDEKDFEGTGVALVNPFRPA